MDTLKSKEQIQPVYSELQGYLDQAPNNSKVIPDEDIWNQYNATIDVLASVTKQDYGRWRLEPLTYQLRNFKGVAVPTSGIKETVYRQKLAGLIAWLHGEYFADEPAPFASMPSTIIHQNQTQNQSVHVEVLLELSNLINDKMNKVAEGTPEKKFLEKVRGTLSKVKSVSQFITLVMTTAKEMGITLEQLTGLFS